MNGQSGKVCGELPIDGAPPVSSVRAVWLPLFALLLRGGIFYGEADEKNGRGDFASSVLR